MIRLRKMLLTVLCLVLVLSATVSVAAACNKRETGYKLTLTYNSEGGSVTASQPLQGELYDGKEMVTVTVSPAEGYIVESFEVSGHEDAVLDVNSAYSFAITADTTVTVVFAESTSVEGDVTVTATVTPSEGGSVALSPVAADNLYKRGSYITLSVSLNEHYRLVSVTKNGQPLELNTQLRATFRADDDAEILVTLRKAYEVTLDYDSDGAEVSLSPTSADNLYDPDTPLTLSVSVKGNFRLVCVRVDGVEVSLTEGSYSFTVTDDVTIEVVTDLPLPQGVLDSVRGSAYFVAEMTETDYSDGNEYLSTLYTLFDSAAKAVQHREIFEGDTIYDNIYSDVNGSVAQLWRGIDGTLSRLKPTDDEGAELDLPFADYFNPFDILTEVDFTYVGNNVWQLIDNDKASAASYALTDYDDDIISFRIRVDNGAIASIEIESDIMTINEDSFIGSFQYEIQHSYTFTVDEVGSAAIPAERLTNYTLSAEHDALQQAVDVAKSATSYKATVNMDIADETISSVFYYANDVLWESAGEDSLGYFMRSDGYLWMFMQDNGTLVPDEYPLEIDTLSAVLASFLPEGASLSVFEAVGDGVYRLRDFDAMQTYADSSTFGGMFANAFALGIELQIYFPTAQNLTVTVKNGEIYKVEFDFILFDLTHTEIIFEDYNATTLPEGIDVSGLFAGSFDPTYVGNWVVDGTAEQLEIALDWVTINDEDATLLSGNAQDGYEVTCGGVTYTLRLDGEHLIVTYDDNEHIYRKKLCDWEMFIGEYYTLDNNGQRATIDITVSGLTVTIGGKAHEALYMNFNYNQNYECWLFSFYLDDNLTTAYFLMQIGDGYELLNLFDENYDTDMLFRTDEYVPDLSAVAGEYVTDDGKYTVTLTANGITLAVKGANGSVSSYTAEYVDIATFTNEDGDEFLQISFWANDVKYFLQNAATFKLGWMFFWNLDESIDTEVLEPDFEMGWEMYVGVFNGVSAGVTYSVNISADGITVTMGSDTFTAANIFFNYDAEYGMFYFKFELDGNTYYLEQADISLNRLHLYNEKESIDLVVVREGTVFDLTHFVGTYEGTDENTGVKYVVVVTEHTVTVTIGNASPVQAEIVDYDSRNGVVYLTINGKDYLLVDYYDTFYFQDYNGNLSVQLGEV